MSVTYSSGLRERKDQLPVRLVRDSEWWKTYQGTRKRWEDPCWRCREGAFVRFGDLG